MQILSEKMFLMDLETSGLHRQNDQIISIGCSYQKDQSCMQKTFFFTSLEEEKEGLKQFLVWCQSFDTIVTFRGKGFDYPFLLARLAFHQLSDEGFLKLKLLDIEKYLKPFSSHRQTLEKMLHITRQSTSTGQDVAHLYRTYISCKDPLYKKLILLHQQDELTSLLGILELYQMLYHLQTASIHSTIQKGDALQITYDYGQPFLTTFHHAALGLTFAYTSGNALMTLTYPLVEGSFKHPLTPVKDYFYIESEGQLIHRSLASFIPQSQKRKAKKEECFICEQHIFLPLFTTHQLTEKLWYDSEKKPYIIWHCDQVRLLGDQVFSAFFHTSKSTSS